MNFQDIGLDNRLLKFLTHMEITTPTPIQAQSIPHMMLGQNVLVCAQTGSGKTLGYLLPMLHGALKNKAFSKNDPRGLVIVPTRELAKQVYVQLRQILQGMSYTSGLIVGGDNFNDQEQLLRKHPRFIVATPGRLADHVTHGNVHLDKLETLILDEADRMLDMGFQESLHTILKHATHRKLQVGLFSATIDKPDLTGLIKNLLVAPKILNLSEDAFIPEEITQSFYVCDSLKHKERLLSALLKQVPRQKTMIFTATRDDAQRLSELLNGRDQKSSYLHAQLSQSERDKVLRQFSQSVYKILVTTDVASRGIDIDDISHVINFDLPIKPEDYIHRIGRTGRAGRSGSAISFVSSKDWLAFERINERYDLKPEWVELSEFKPKKTLTDLTSEHYGNKKKSTEKTPKKQNKIQRKLSAQTLGYEAVGFTPVKRKRILIVEVESEES